MFSSASLPGGPCKFTVVRQPRAICFLVGLILLTSMRLLAQDATSTSAPDVPAPFHINSSEVKIDPVTHAPVWTGTPDWRPPIPIGLIIPPQDCSDITAIRPDTPPVGTTLDFDNLQCLERVGPYYAGGNGGLGTGPGPNYGVKFSCNALAVSVPPAACPAANEQGYIVNSESVPSAPNAVFWLEGLHYSMNVPEGFKNSVSFYYSAPFYGGSVEVWTEVRGAGEQLATMALSTNKACAFPHNYCTWTQVTVNFTGTAKSVTFGGLPNYIAFDNITLGSN